jgi:TPR repeat protein
MVLVAVMGIIAGLLVQELRRRLPSPPVHGNLEVAEHEFRAGDEKIAFAQFQKLADQGKPAAQYWLAHMTELGLGVPQDIAKAVDLYRKAAAKNIIPAELRLGEIYLHGDLVPPDFAQAKTYLSQAANQGNARAATLLGQMYRLGLGMPADAKEACIWSEVGTIEGNALARRERDALMPTLSAEDQKDVSVQAQQILASIRRASGTEADTAQEKAQASETQTNKAQPSPHPDGSPAK